MDVDKISFPNKLFHILKAMSESHFVALDFEFSGIASKPPGRKKHTLQERYEETKCAAERYTILQVGLTCAVEDKNTETYVLQAFNIPLCSTFDQDLDIERQWSFQSGAVEFLLKNNFNFTIPFEDGVPYLSRDEEHAAKHRFKAKEDKSQIEDITFEETDKISAAFLAKIRGEIDRWVDTMLPHYSEVSILSRTKVWQDCGDTEGDLTSFDKRLIHQLVRAEYPMLISIGRRSSIIIKRLDEEREQRIRRDKYNRFKQKIYKQIGFRWIIEALCGGNLDRIDISWFAQDPDTGEPRVYNILQFEAEFNRATQKLRRHRPVLVGHNLFTDIIYLYKTFIGKLPDTVAEFGTIIHNLFPTIVDTKYMFTHDCGSLNPASSLDQIEEKLRIQRVPMIAEHDDNKKYSDSEDIWHHEAGYDSLLTARVMILLSAKLEADNTYVSAVIQSDSITSNATNRSTIASPRKSRVPPTHAAIDGNSPSELPLRKQKRASPTPVKSRFASRTAFEALESTEPGNASKESSDGEQITTPASSSHNVITDSGLQSTTGSLAGAKVSSREHNPHPLMPPFDADFWRVYANKLRVFGTVEGLLNLHPLEI